MREATQVSAGESLFIQYKFDQDDEGERRNEVEKP